MKKMLEFIERYHFIAIFVTFLVAVFIFYMSSLSFEKGLPGPVWKSYAYHFLIFFIFSLFFSISLSKGKYSLKSYIFIAILFSMSYAALDELHQFFVPNRASDYKDFITDSVGILTSSISYYFTIIIRKKG